MSALDETLKRHRQRVIAREEQTFRELLQAYALIERELRESLRELERKINDAQAAGEVISPSWYQQGDRLKDLIDQVKSQIERFGGTAANITAREQRAAVTLAADAARATVQVIAPNSFPIGTSFNPLVVEDAVGMMGDGSPILEYYSQNLAPKVAEAIRVEVIKAAATGTDFRTLARRLLQTGQITKHRALTVARTEVGRVRRETTRRIYQDTPGVVGWEWVASKSPRTCVVCLAMDGKIFPLEEAFPQHINCRCTMIAVIDGVPRPPRTLGKEWFDKQPDDVKAKIIGVDGLAAYKEGLITLDDFVGKKPHPLFGESVFTKPLSDILANKPVTEKVIRTPRDVNVYFDDDYVESQLQDILGRELSHDEIGGLVGALDGADIFVEEFDDKLLFRIVHPLIAEQQRTLETGWDGNTFMHNVIFRKSRTAPKSTGLKSFATQVFHAERFGVSFIETDAAGNYESSLRKGGWNGYYTWGRFGYNAALSPEERERFPSPYKAARDVNDLFIRNNNGSKVWLYFGSGRPMLFDLDQDSRSFEILRNYLHEKGFDVDFD